MPGRVGSWRFSWPRRSPKATRKWNGPGIEAVLEGPGYTVEALLMDHGTPSVAYVVRETPRRNVDSARLAALGLRPGPWLQRVRGPQADDEEVIVVEGTARRVRELQDDLLVVTPGDSVAYLTDFLLDEAAVERLTPALKGVGAVVCESQYRHADVELARTQPPHDGDPGRHPWRAGRAWAGWCCSTCLTAIRGRSGGSFWPRPGPSSRATTFPDHWMTAVEQQG